MFSYLGGGSSLSSVRRVDCERTDDFTILATSSATLRDRARAPPFETACDDLATQTLTGARRQVTGSEILRITLHDVAHDDVGPGSTQQKRDQDSVQPRQPVVTHCGWPPAIPSSLGKRPFDMVRMTSTDRLSSRAPAGSRL